MLTTDIEQDPYAPERCFLVIHWLADNGLDDDQLEPVFVLQEESEQVELLCMFASYVDAHGLAAIDRLWAQERGSWRAARYVKALAAAFAKRYSHFNPFVV